MKNTNKTLIDRNCYAFAKRASTVLLLIVLQLVGFHSMAQDPPQYGTPFQGVPHRMDANIYQMNLREYSASRNIAGARAKLQRIKDLGVNVIYLMPIYPLGVTNNPDGSPYSHQDLKSVASDLGTLSDLRGLVEDAHNLGMSVILDWVANQTAWDHPWITQHPDWYVQDSNGNIEYPCPDPGNYCFTDVAWLDLDNSSAAAAMIDAMRYWIFAANVDGFRFDWADKAPPAFWTNAVSNLRSISSHDLLLLAEGSNEGASTGCTPFCGDNEPGYHYAQGFDYIFGTNFYWNVMKKVWNSGEPVTNLDGVSNGEYIGASSTQLVARYLSNHDDYNAEGSPFSFLQGGRAGTMAAFALATYHRSVPFIYNGIEVGNTNPLPYPWNSGNINWTQDLTVYTEMQSMLAARNNSVALRRGLPVSYIDPANTNPNVFAFTKESGGEKVAVLINPRGGNSSFTIPSGMAGTYNDIFVPGGSSITWTTGQNVTLAPYEYMVLTNSNVPVVDVTGVSVSPTSATISEGLTQILTASISPSNATNQNVTWSSNNNSVATVNSSGTVTAVSPGSATITATTEDGGFTANATINVNPAPTFTVHFYKPASWGTGINIYWWDAQPSGVLADGSWPGVGMTDEGSGWYSHTFTNVTSTNLIFNDGTNQTADLSRSTTGWYQNGVWYDTNPGGCSPTAITPYTSVNGGVWNQTATATLDAGGSVTFGPQPTGGSWSWTGPNNYSADVREISLSNVQTNDSGDYIATYTNSCGTPSTQTFSLTVNPVAVPQSPYGGVAHSIPGTIEMEDFDNGGEGTAYHDNDASNNGGQYRTADGVDLEAASGGGYNIGWTNAGEWTEYTVNVANSGNYNLEARVSSPSGGTFQIEMNGANVSGTMTVPNTGGWQSWQSVSVQNITLTAGQHIMRLAMNSGGFNIDKVTFTASTTDGGPGFYIVNRWQGTYMYDAGNNVGYGSFSTSDNYQWELELVDGHQAIKNVGTGDYINIESLTGTAECSAVSTGYWSAQWAIEDYDGHKRIRNRWQSGDYLHIENLTGSVQSGYVYEGAYSGHWTFESASGARLRETEEQPGLIQEVLLYPNPVQDLLHVRLSDDTNRVTNIRILDTSGRMIQLDRFVSKSTNTIDVDLSSLKRGIYVVVINDYKSYKITKL